MLASYPPASRLTNDCSTPRYKRRLPIDDPMLEELSMTETPIAFRVDNVIRAVSGYSSVFLCRGQLYRDANGQIGAAAQEPGVSDLADDLLRDAELYIRYEPPSPKAKRRCAGLSPFRLTLSTSDGSMLSSFRGLSFELDVDETQGVVHWGTSLALAFPASKDLQSFLTCADLAPATPNGRLGGTQHNKLVTPPTLRGASTPASPQLSTSTASPFSLSTPKLVLQRALSTEFMTLRA
ncbi:hypothetical protein APUTEX25_000104 [Auxenochlorella protothecoides]|uniref:Uncharacterized protein n=1 Tax=Auxenochlorella protothecoides TaxID=3075 RepID=A0A3M7KYH3_AUXPR|nr:hypothetical protein APUTEX25_000104 [Auxenochlorella protothecoides]|eukprot:RMZ55521.1 hypothetical protein APUTEX25_000104 [Auxenochlorella protothecoides]